MNLQTQAYRRNPVRKYSYGMKHDSNKKKMLAIAIVCSIVIFAFVYVPLFGWLYAFYDYKVGLKLFECKFVGFKFFKIALTQPDLLLALRNTLVFSFLGIATSPLPAIFAILLSQMRSQRFCKIIQVTTTLPNFISMVIVYSIFFAFFSVGDGFINNVFLKYNILKQPTDILTNSDLVWYFQTFIGIWKGLGFGAIIYFATLVGIDQELFDAASVDGANRWQTVIHITVPGIIPTYLNLLLLSIGGLLGSNFEQGYLFYNPLIHEKILTLDLYLYRIGLMGGDYPLSTAVGISRTFISLILLFAANTIAKRLRGYSII